MGKWRWQYTPFQTNYFTLNALLLLHFTRRCNKASSYIEDEEEVSSLTVRNNLTRWALSRIPREAWPWTHTHTTLGRRIYILTPRAFIKYTHTRTLESAFPAHHDLRCRGALCKSSIFKAPQARVSCPRNEMQVVVFVFCHSKNHFTNLNRATTWHTLHSESIVEPVARGSWILLHTYTHSSFLLQNSLTMVLY